MLRWGWSRWRVSGKNELKVGIAFLYVGSLFKVSGKNELKEENGHDAVVFNREVSGKNELKDLDQGTKLLEHFLYQARMS